MPAKRRPSRTPVDPATVPLLELEQVAEEFHAWALAHVEGLTAEDVHQLWQDVTLAVRVAGESAGLRHLGSWTAEHVRDLAEALEDLDDTIETIEVGLLDDEDDDAWLDEDDDDALGDRVTASLGPLVTFLSDTGRWTGTDDALDAVFEAIAEIDPVGAVVAALSAIVEEPPSSLQVEADALRDLPLAQHLMALLRWLTPRRAVTTSGGLRQGDLPEAAALVGVDLSDRRVRAMRDVRVLPHLWRALEDAELLTVGASVAKPTPLGSALAQRSPHEQLDSTDQRALASAVVAAVEHLLSETPPRPWLTSTGALVAPLLSGALASGMVPAEAVDLAEEMGSVRPLLGTLAELGVVAVDADGSVLIPAGLERVVAVAVLRALETLTDAELEVPADVDPFAPPPPQAGTALRLVVELVGARPPVRREVLVDAASVVGQLHEVVQAAVGWDDSHPWAFAVPSGARSSTPIGEHRPLRRVLRSRRDVLLYTYDFGDDWEHRITLLGTEQAEPGLLPRCTAATGRGPLDDSGGVLGWAHMVEAANNPKHPEHADARDWLGLTGRDRLDPTAVDVAECDRRLAHLR